MFIKYTDSKDVVIADVYLYNRLPYLVAELYATALSSKVVRKLEASILV